MPKDIQRTPWQRAILERNSADLLQSPPANGGKRTKHPTGVIGSEMPHERRTWGDMIGTEDAARWTYAEACAHLQRLGLLDTCLAHRNHAPAAPWLSVTSTTA